MPFPKSDACRIRTLYFSPLRFDGRVLRTCDPAAACRWMTNVMTPLWFIGCVLALFMTAPGLYAQGERASGPDIVAKHTFVMTQPPQHVPTGTVVDGPILGNGDLGVALGGPPEDQRFYFGKNDFWSQQQSPMSVGGVALSIPDLAGASYRQEQDLSKAEVRGTFTKGSSTVHLRTWVGATENVMVTEMSLAGGGGIPVSLQLFPASTALKDNNKPVNLGREQHGNGRWYFSGLITDVHVYDRALPDSEIRRSRTIKALKMAWSAAGTSTSERVRIRWTPKSSSCGLLAARPRLPFCGRRNGPPISPAVAVCTPRKAINSITRASRLPCTATRRNSCTPACTAMPARCRR